MASQLAYKDIDLLRLLNKKAAPSEKNKRARRILIVLGCFLLILGGLFGLYAYEVANIEAQKDTLNAYLWDSKVLSDYALAKESKDIMLLAQMKAERLSATLEQISGAAALSASDYAKIKQLGGSSIWLREFSYLRDEASVHLDFVAAGVDDISGFVAKLASSGLFYSVQHVGYKQNHEGGYDFSVFCTLEQEAAHE